MKVLLVDADSTIPNLALMKLSRYHKCRGDSVELLRLGIPFYPWMYKKEHFIDTIGYDKVYCSVIFEGNKQYVDTSLFSDKEIIFGGTGVSLELKLDDEIEDLEPDYTIYPENDISYGFITRGCIRNCYFCKVPKKEGKLRQVSTVDKIVRHKETKFMDNNILAFDGHKSILQELIDKNIRCQFNQGLDIRLLDRENANLLSKMNYSSFFSFAFDDYRYLSMIEEKLPLLEFAKNWRIRLFVYANKEMPLSDTVKRIMYCKEKQIYPYVMRDINIHTSKYKEFYSDLTGYCNYVGYFKGMTWDEFLEYRHPGNDEKIKKHTELFYSALDGGV